MISDLYGRVKATRIIVNRNISGAVPLGRFGPSVDKQDRARVNSSRQLIDDSDELHRTAGRLRGKRPAVFFGAVTPLAAWRLSPPHG